MAAPGYHVSNTMAGSLQAISSSYKTLARVLVAASSGKRFEIFDIEAGQNAVPNASDCPIEFDLTFCSAAGAGTGTAATPYNAIDVAVCTALVNCSAEPTTYTQASNFWHRAINQHNSVRYTPDYGKEIVIPAVASTGPGLRALSTVYTGTCPGSIRFIEY